jgi:hypothetical protein
MVHANLGPIGRVFNMNEVEVMEEYTNESTTRA